ncbi:MULTISPECIES: hypothetical protein [unclassified Leisingera]|uniref:hypothetical protein n=1 Tax=unclassified Leisingera TaxID=2614906 RepID=UPI0021A57468|nr:MULTISPECIES: hypothetical protein [unclassified Leisingera]UWQ76041.1 hypothetical protein K3724_06280 [Leisingera sp. M658]
MTTKTVKLTTLAAALCLLAAPAFSGQCPADIAKIDAAIAAGTALSEDDLADVQDMRDEGQSLHDGGDHAASVAILAEAKALLGIE